MKVVLALEGRSEEIKVLKEVSELCHEIGWELQVLHVEDERGSGETWLHQNDYPNLSSTMSHLTIIDNTKGSVVNAVKAFIDKNECQLLILVNKGRLKKGIEQSSTLISGLLHDLCVSVLVLPEQAESYKLKRILLTTKANKIHDAIPSSMRELLHEWPFELTLMHFSKTGMAYKSDINSNAHPGWLLEAFEEKTEGQLMEVLNEMILANKLDVLAFEIDKGEHPFINSDDFKSFYEACRSPLLFVPIVS